AFPYQPLCDVYSSTLTRITVTFNDGTEMVLVDAGTNGAPKGSPGNCNSPGFDRGTTFITTDGSAATFIADNHIYDPNIVWAAATYSGAGTFYFRDGRQFRFGTHIVDQFMMTMFDWIQDRNGNRTTFDYSATPPAGFSSAFSITDSAGRISKVAIGHAYT